MLWANNEGTHKVENNERPSVNRKRPETEFYRSMPGKMKWPPIAEVQGKFRESAKSGYRFPQLI